MEVLKLRFFLYSVLGFVLGLTWLLALVAVYLNGEVLELWYSFIVLHGLQVKDLEIKRDKIL